MLQPMDDGMDDDGAALEGAGGFEWWPTRTDGAWQYCSRIRKCTWVL